MFVGDQCGRAEEAINFYVSLFPDSRVTSIEKWKHDEPGGEEGLVKQASFILAGQQYMASENRMGHEFSFTPAISIYVACDSEEELARLFGRLSEGGKVMMPVGDYGFSRKFGWTADKYGVSWQLNLA